MTVSKTVRPGSWPGTPANHARSLAATLELVGECQAGKRSLEPLRYNKITYGSSNVERVVKETNSPSLHKPRPL